jgi:hypothetical protein
MFVFRIPAPPPLAFFVSGLVPVGAGFEFGGKLTVTSLGAGAKIEAKAKTEVGVVCPASTDCSFHRSLSDFTLSFTPTANVPSLSDLRLEPSLDVFGFVKAGIGNPFLTSVRVDAVEAKLGGKLQGSFAPRVVQILDDSYKSNYTLSFEASAKAGPRLGDLAELFGLNSLISVTLLEISTGLAQSPTGAVTADRASYQPGDPVTVRVLMNADTRTFLGLYNINRILLVRRAGASDTVLQTQSATAGQSEFVFTFAAPGPLSASELFAFVDTVIPFDLSDLEVGKATGQPAEVQVVVSPPSATLSPGGVQQFTASLAAGIPLTDVTWSVTGGGTISATGLFTAGATPGTFTVRATSNTTPSLFGEAQVTVIAGAAVLVNSTLLDIMSSNGSDHYEDTAPVVEGTVQILADNDIIDTTFARRQITNEPEFGDGRVTLELEAHGDTNFMTTASLAARSRIVFTLGATSAYELGRAIECGGPFDIGGGGTVSASVSLTGFAPVTCSTLGDRVGFTVQGTLPPGQYTMEVQVNRFKGPMDSDADVQAVMSLSLTPVSPP